MIGARLDEQEIRQIIGAHGDGDLIVDGIAPIDALTDHVLAFARQPLTPDQRDAVARVDRCIVIVPPGSGIPQTIGTSRLLESPRPRTAIADVLTFVRDHNRLQPWTSNGAVASSASVSPLAVIEANVDIGDDVVVEPFCTIGPDVAIGGGSVVQAGARIRPRVRIGERTVIGANSVIGTPGFGFVRDPDGEKTRIPHLGGIVIGSDVEIGALTIIQSGTIGPTRIDDRVKIGETSAVGHNAHIQRGVRIVAGVIVGGSAVIEANAWIGMNATVREGRVVGRRALIGMDVSVQDDLSQGGVIRAPQPDVRPRRRRAPP